jgi:hypothetical protein
MWQTDAISMRSCDSGFPLSFTEAVTIITAQELSDSTSYCNAVTNSTDLCVINIIVMAHT